MKPNVGIFDFAFFHSRQPLRKLHGRRYSGVYVIFVVVTHRLKKFTVYIFDFLFRWLGIGVNIFGFWAKSRQSRTLPASPD